MRKAFLCLLLALLWAFPALGEGAAAPGVALAGETAGAVCLPEGSDEASARYVYRYSYPLLADTGDCAQMINSFYAYLVTDAMNFAVPMTYETLGESDVQAYTNITSQVMCNTAEYFSVLVTTERFIGAEASQVIAGHTFALTGAKAGSPISLPYLLGLVDADESDTWLVDRATAKADALVYDLVWAVIQSQLAAGEVAYYPDLTREELEAQFYPEEDFYLDEGGNPVFYIQPSYLASEAEGVLTYPFTVAELLDAM